MVERRLVEQFSAAAADESSMKALALLVFAVLAAGCGSSGEPASAEPAPPSSEFALPVTAPMQARERMLHDLDKQKQLARDRAAQAGEAGGRDD